MVCISTSLTYYFNSFIHRKCFFIHKDTNQLRNYHRRMGIINLDNRMVIHFAQIIFLFLHFTQNELCRIAYHKILLVNTQKVPRFIGIIRVQEQSQVLFHLFFVEVYPFFYNAFIQGLNIEQTQLVHTVIIAYHINII